MRTFSWTEWHVTLPSVLVLAAALTVGVLRWKVLRRSAWCVGSAAAIALFASPLHSFAMDSYPSHMAEHLLLVLVVAPLLVWGWRTTGLSPSWSVLPFLLYVVLIPTYHLTSLGGLIMRSPGEHALELSLFALVGIALWVGPYGQQFQTMQRVTYVALALPASVFSGVALMSSTTAPFNLMSMPHMPVDLVDLHRGGLTMAVLSAVFQGVHLILLARLEARQR